LQKKEKRIKKVVFFSSIGEKKKGGFVGRLRPEGKGLYLNARRKISERKKEKGRGSMSKGGEFSPKTINTWCSRGSKIKTKKGLGKGKKRSCSQVGIKGWDLLTWDRH